MVRHFLPIRIHINPLTEVGSRVNCERLPRRAIRLLRLHRRVRSPCQGSIQFFSYALSIIANYEGKIEAYVDWRKSFLKIKDYRNKSSRNIGY